MGSDLYVTKVLNWGENMRGTSPYWKSITTAERSAAGTHCGPHDSYPLGPGCKHVSAAFHLATSGHGQPNLGCIRSYAKRNKCAMPPSQKAFQEMLDITQGY